METPNRKGPGRRGPEGFRARLAWWLLERPGSALELLAERRHLIVRAEMRRTRRSRLATGAVCAAVPLLAFLLALPLVASWDAQFAPGGGGETAIRAVLAFAGLWPLVMYLGAAMSAAAAVTEEVERETALQLVLTPVASRPLAAAKILPRVRPYLWGILAALPLYALVGASTGLMAEGFIPLPTLVWPLRLVAPLVHRGGPTLSALGVLAAAPLMGLLDLSLVWAAAHWGAVFAIRYRRLLPAAVRIAVQLPLTAAAAGLCVIGGWLAAMLPVSCAAIAGRSQGPTGLVLGITLGVLAGGAALAFLWWHVMLVRPAEEALTAFQAFDRLANAEFDVGIPRWVETGGKGGNR